MVAPFVVAAALLVAGCGGGEESERSPSDDPTAVDPGPDVAFADLEMVPQVSTYTRDFFDDLTLYQLFAAYVGTPDGDRVVAKATDYENDYVVVGEPGSLPTYWQEAEDRETFANGWTCGTLRSGIGCHRMLTDGLLEITCEVDECTLGQEELADLSGMFYEAFTGGSTSGGSADPPQPCDGVDAEEVAEALGSALGDGEVVLEIDSSELGEFYTCYVSLPAGSLERNSAELEIVRHEYSADTLAGTEDCTFGGTTAEEVYESATACAEEAGVEFASEPAEDGDGGTMVSEAEIVHAEEGDFWWEVSLSDDTLEPELFDTLTDLARTLPAS